MELPVTCGFFFLLLLLAAETDRILYAAGILNVLYVAACFFFVCASLNAQVIIIDCVCCENENVIEYMYFSFL